MTVIIGSLLREVLENLGGLDFRPALFRSRAKAPYRDIRIRRLSSGRAAVDAAADKAEESLLAEGFGTVRRGWSGLTALNERQGPVASRLHLLIKPCNFPIEVL